MQRRTVILADDQPLVLAGLRELLAEFWTVVAAVNDGRALVEAALRLRPNLTILAVGLPQLNGIDAARQIRAQWPEAKLLFFTTHRRLAFVEQALEAGARGYVLKTAPLEEIRRAVDCALNGKVYISSAFGEEALEHLRSTGHKPQRWADELTPRQREILQLIAEGRSNKEVAKILCISVKTVGFHRERIMQNLGVHTTAGLALAAVRLGLISEPDASAVSGVTPEGKTLEELWFKRVTEAKLTNRLAAARVKEIQREVSGMSSPDGHYAQKQALHAETESLAEYHRVLRIYSDLTLHGKLPEEGDWPSGKEGS